MANDSETAEQKKEKYQAMADSFRELIAPALVGDEKFDVHLVADHPLYMVIPTIYRENGSKRQLVWSILVPCEGFSEPAEPKPTRIPSDKEAALRHRKLTKMFGDQVKSIHALVTQ